MMNLQNKLSILTKLMLVLLLLTCLSIFPALMIFGSKGLVIVGLFYIPAMITALKIDKIKKENNLDTKEKILKFSTSKEKEIAQNNPNIQKIINQLTFPKIILFITSASIIVTLLPVVVYYFIKFFIHILS